MIADRDIRERRPCCTPRSKRIMAIFDEGYQANKKTGKGEKGHANHFDVYLHLSDSKPGRENAMRVRISPITRTFMDSFHTKWSCLGRTRSPAYSQ